ncbi:MAG: transketolase [Alphaproteobacteria bacterium]|nr:MAG: transketolase [Alphaproteobacteria bacterium]
MRQARSISAAKAAELAELARIVRIDSVRMIQHAGSGNPGSTLSIVDVLVWLYFHEMHINRADCRDADRDRLILSKGQAAPAYYSIFAKLGWLSENELMGFRGFETRLQTHPEYDTIPAIDFTSGSLGMGLSAANGMALAARYKGLNDLRFFCILGDGEQQEGQVWEAAMTAGHYKLSNVINIIDRNVFQGDRSSHDVMELEPLADKWRAFGWDVQAVDGHDFGALADCMAAFEPDKPKLMIANTVKGKGVSFMEGDNLWHTGGPKFDQGYLERALADLGVQHG